MMKLNYNLVLLSFLLLLIGIDSISGEQEGATQDEVIISDNYSPTTPNSHDDIENENGTTITNTLTTEKPNSDENSETNQGRRNGSNHDGYNGWNSLYRQLFLIIRSVCDSSVTFEGNIVIEEQVMNKMDACINPIDIKDVEGNIIWNKCQEETLPEMPKNESFIVKFCGRQSNLQLDKYGKKKLRKFYRCFNRERRALMKVNGGESEQKGKGKKIHKRILKLDENDIMCFKGALGFDGAQTDLRTITGDYQVIKRGIDVLLNIGYRYLCDERFQDRINYHPDITTMDEYNKCYQVIPELKEDIVEINEKACFENRKLILHRSDSLIQYFKDDSNYSTLTTKQFYETYSNLFFQLISCQKISLKLDEKGTKRWNKIESRFNLTSIGTI